MTSGTLPVLKSGDLAYFDAFLDGLIPCKVVSIRSVHVRGSEPHCDVTFKLTKSVRAWKRGEVLTRSNLGPCPVIPRGAIRRTHLGAVRIGLYNIQADAA